MVFLITVVADDIFKVFTLLSGFSITPIGQSATFFLFSLLFPAFLLLFLGLHNSFFGGL